MRGFEVTEGRSSSLSLLPPCTSQETKKRGLGNIEGVIFLKESQEK